MISAFRDNLIKKLGEESLRKIESAKVGLAGAGGLGSNCAANLVRVGFKNILIVDFDVVDASNLDRQFYFLDQVGIKKVEALRRNLLKINPDLALEMFDQKIDKSNARSVFDKCDLVVECFDCAKAKSMLVEEMLLCGKFVVSVSGLGGFGSSDEIRVRRAGNNLVLIGDLISDNQKFPALSPRVNVAAAKQADVILEFITKARVL
jgi:sulfur carrier protein ThiS adenylyltransferase